VGNPQEIMESKEEMSCKGKNEESQLPINSKVQTLFPADRNHSLTIGCFHSDSVKQEKRDGRLSSPHKTKQLRSRFFTAAHQIGISPDRVLFCSDSSKKRETTYCLQMLLLHLHEIFAFLHFWKFPQNGGLSLFVLLNSLLF
jgi:hypothetical protein